MNLTVEPIATSYIQNNPKAKSEIKEHLEALNILFLEIDPQYSFIGFKAIYYKSVLEGLKEHLEYFMNLPIIEALETPAKFTDQEKAIVLNTINLLIPFIKIYEKYHEVSIQYYQAGEPSVKPKEYDHLIGEPQIGPIYAATQKEYNASVKQALLHWLFIRALDTHPNAVAGATLISIEHAMAHFFSKTLTFEERSIQDVEQHPLAFASDLLHLEKLTEAFHSLFAKTSYSPAFRTTLENVFNRQADTVFKAQILQSKVEQKLDPQEALEAALLSWHRFLNSIKAVPTN